MTSYAGQLLAIVLWPGVFMLFWFFLAIFVYSSEPNNVVTFEPLTRNVKKLIWP